MNGEEFFKTIYHTILHNYLSHYIYHTWEAGSVVGKTALSELGVSGSNLDDDKLMLKRLYESGTN